MLSRPWSKQYIIFPLLSSNNSKTLLGKHLCSDQWCVYRDVAAQHLQQELGFPSWGEQEVLGEAHFGGQGNTLPGLWVLEGLWVLQT